MYRTTPAGTTVSLLLGGAYYSARVWLNGAYLGGHEGYFAPFEFDVTDVVVLDEENENLALTMAEQGKRVLLVDADMRRASVASECGLEESAGLTVLVGEATLEEVAGLGHSDPAGRHGGHCPAQPRTACIESEAMSAFLHRARHCTTSWSSRIHRVDDTLRRLAEDMYETMLAAPASGWRRHRSVSCAV